MNLDAEYKKYVEHWGDPIDPINYKLYSMETDMPCFHPDNRLFTKEEFKEQLEKVSPQDPAICNYSGLRSISGYTREEEDTEEYKAYRRGWIDGYDEGLYDKNIK